MSVRATGGTSYVPRADWHLLSDDSQAPETSPDRVTVIAFARTLDLVSGSKD